MASLSNSGRSRGQSNVLLESEPWVTDFNHSSDDDKTNNNSTTTTAATISSTKQLIKISNAGQVVWSRVDINSTRSYEYLSSELELSSPVFVVNNDVTNLISSTPQLQHVLSQHGDTETPLRLEVYLNPLLKQSLLSQSFVFVENFDPQELLQSITEQVQRNQTLNIQLTEASVEEPDVPLVPNQEAATSTTNATTTTTTTTASELFALAVTTNTSDQTQIPTVNAETIVENPEPLETSIPDLSTHFPYHCPNAKIRAWIHAVFIEHQEDAEMKVISLKQLYNQVLCQTKDLNGTPISSFNIKTQDKKNERKRIQYEQIELDIPRTFSISSKECRAERDAKLRRILRATSQRISSGYVQGQNFIIGYLLTVTNIEADIFALFVGLMERGPRVSDMPPRYGLVGMYDTNMPRLNALVYAVDHLLMSLSPKLHHHLVNEIGIATSLLYVPGWTLTMFTNRLSPEAVGPLFDQIMHGGYHAIVRLCLAALLAHEKELLTFSFEEGLTFLQQHLW